jgi:hypothetical protein
MMSNVESAPRSNNACRCFWRTALAEGQRLGSPGARSAEREDRPSCLDVSRTGHPIERNAEPRKLGPFNERH